MEHVPTYNLRRKDMEIYCYEDIGLYSVVHEPSGMYLYVGTWDDCIDYTNRYE